MSFRLNAVSLVAILALCLGQASGQAKKPFDELNGTWTIIKMDASGKSLLQGNETWKLIIKDGIATMDAKDAPKEAKDLSKFLDPSKKIKTITLPLEGTVVFYGIYEVKGGELRVCGEGVDTAQEKTPEAQRPKKFDSNEGVLLVFKRDKK